MLASLAYLLTQHNNNLIFFSAINPGITTIQRHIIALERFALKS